MNIQSIRPGNKWYLGVRCRKCRTPILFALDHNHGDTSAQIPRARTLVLTCPSDECRHKSDYTGDLIVRLQKLPDKASPQTFGGKTNGKSR
jgi:hypothetical protein